MQLIKSPVIFDPSAHTYTLNGVQLQGITGMLSNQLFPNKYDEVPKYILDQAAERGSYVHEVCELVDELGVTHDSSEARQYQFLKEMHDLHHEASEYLVSDGKHFASCIDKVYRESECEFSLGDIKTTYKLDRDYVRWQLSVYAYLFELQNPGAKVVRLFALWLRDDTGELVLVERIPSDMIIDLLTAEAEGRKFQNPYPSVELTLPEKYREAEESIIEICNQCKYWADQKKDLTDHVMQEMVKAGVYSWKGNNIAFIRKKDSIRKTFDRAAFDRDYPGLYEKYMTDTPVCGSVTVKVS